MTWQGRQLPPNWQTLRRQRFDLDGWACVDCGHHDPTGSTLECDHIGDRDDHRLEKLRTRCADIAKGGNGCHRQRTNEAAASARGVGTTRLRPPPAHPGLR